MSDISINQKSPNKNKKKSQYAKEKLPTPPPDPRGSSKQKDPSDNEVFEYLENILSDYAKGISLFTPVIATEEAFDHLEKLYKLMEQMLELKEQNVRLHRKIRELEYLNNLEKIQRDLEASGVDNSECPDIYREALFAEAVLESILSDSEKRDCKSKSPTRLRPSILRKQISRTNPGPSEKLVSSETNVSTHRQDSWKNDKSAKISKWTKVKAAFKWEKASGVSENKQQSKGVHVPVNVEIAKYLRVPSSGEEPGQSPAETDVGNTTPGSLSAASSLGDFHRTELKTPTEKLRCLEDDPLQHSHIPQCKEDYSSSKLQSVKLNRTPWGKMKEIINTRNSFKKKRLSAASDEIQIDVELCSDIDDNVFDDEKATTSVPSNASSGCSSSQAKPISKDIPNEIVTKYQKAVEECGNKKKSRWAMVKKAFITADPPTSFYTSPKDNFDAEEEIQENYKKLQQKLSLEFQDKIQEWERLKQNSPSASNITTFSFGEETKDPNFAKKMEEWEKKKHQVAPKSPMPSESDLPPDFKKKLQEWEKIKKSSGGNPKKKLSEVPKWKSLGGPRSDNAVECPPLSDDFIRKLREWRQIKASRTLETRKPGDKTPSPRLSRKNSSPRYVKRYKDQDKDKDLLWVDREINKLEKEKQNLEKEMQKFIEKEERLTKLKKSAIGGDKKEVLIYTPSGFHRFEGISRKFTRKLYEWEKAQGIAPEASTFALLTSSVKPALRPIMKRHSSYNLSSLVRSKSADSIAVSALNLACPLLSQQPSSMSLNDVNELENDCLLDSKGSSMQYLIDSQEDLDEDEPQAVLVEVEDYEEETAAPLYFVAEKQQLPVYQRQEFKNLCAGETIAAPKVRRSESTRAQTNYNLIEEIINFLKQLAENEIEIKNITQNVSKGHLVSENKLKLKELFSSQRKISNRTSDKLLKLQEANNFVISSISRCDTYAQAALSDNLEGVQDISNEVIQMAEKMDQTIKSRTLENISSNHMTYLSLFENIRDIRTKILELRRHLSYVCAATDSTVPNKKLKSKVHKYISIESKSGRSDTSDNSSEKPKENKRFIKSDTCSMDGNQGAVKKRIKFRQKNMLTRNNAIDSDEDEAEDKEKSKSRQHRKLNRTRTISDGGIDYKPSDKASDGSNIARIIVTTEKNYLNASLNEDMSDSPLTVFVKTTRKLFTPIGESSFNMSSEIKNKNTPSENCTTTVFCTYNEKNENTSLPDIKSHVLPPPSLPSLHRKLVKDISPSIKLMMTKYNQKVSEDSKSVKSGNSSGSSSPLWRTPQSERRVKAQTEKYQEELNKLSPLLGGRREVQKSASVGYIHSGNKQVTVPVREEPIRKTSSNASQVNDTQPLTDHQISTNRKVLTLDISAASCSVPERLSPEIRQKKLQQAKEEFLLSTPVSAHSGLNDNVLTFPTRNRLSQISMESGSSYDNSLPGGLIKSVSSGMINIDAEVYRQIHPDRGYVSLPRSVNPKTSKFGFSSITSRFRKVKMRKGKEKDKMNTVSTLCRQSLVVDITDKCRSVIDGSNK